MSNGQRTRDASAIFLNNICLFFILQKLSFNIKIATIDKLTDKARVKVTFELNKKWIDWNELSEPNR